MNICNEMRRTHQNTAGSTFHHLHHAVVDGILVLLEPPSQVVGDHSGVVNDTKVSLGVASLEVGLAEVGMFALQSLS